MNMEFTQKNTMTNNVKVAVIGAGAAGMLAAGQAAALGADVTVFEKNSRPGRKLRITGKGRCNVINNCTEAEFIENVPRNPRFLYTALDAFSPKDIMEFFESIGVPLKTERGNRVFPVSDKAQDVVDALARYVKDSGAKTVYSPVSRVIKDENGGFTVEADRESYSFDRVIIATGGLSYPLTGSDGDGYRFAENLGHTITDLKPSLVPLECEGKICPSMMGLSLKNIELSVKDERGKVVFREFGEMLFTHFGISGPVVLSASAHLDFDKHSYAAYIDLKPALDDKTLDNRILSDFSKYQNKDLINALGDLLPQKMIAPMIKISGIDPRKKVNSISKEERRSLLNSIKNLEVKITGARPIKEAIITAGGVKVKEIDPKTMESKLVPGLYFAGEIIDCDAYTGGFNLGIAFSTGYLAGRAVAE